MSKEITHGSRHASLRVPRSEYNATNTCEDNCACTHRARLQRYVKSAVVKTPTFQLRGSVSNRNELCVSGRVLIADRSVVGSSDDCAVANDERANGHLVLSRRVVRKRNRVVHEPLIELGTRRASQPCLLLPFAVAAPRYRCPVRRPRGRHPDPTPPPFPPSDGGHS